jgi:asparagine synthase (glutamine-hydrolysing)
MCGICGSVGYQYDKSVVQQMASAMIHRGPDSAGYLDRAPVHLGMRRLRIIDLNTGDQPIYNEDHSIAIVFNGEVYNFQELFCELETLGHHFTTHSDTEVIVHAYEQWGTDCPRHLHGMFAFAIYDWRPLVGKPEVAWRLFIARDRLGIKPLYYYQQDEKTFLFASEVRALLASRQIPKHLSVEGLYTYLAFGSLQEPLTLVEGVRSLPPATWLLVESQAAGWTLRQDVYWEPPSGQNISSTPDDVRSWLSEAVGSHLVSDVPLGAFLSGGLDSGSIVAFGSQALQQPMHTFTMAFDDWSFDERHFAEQTARLWKSDHKCHVIGEQEILADLPQALASMDQPTIDGVNSWYVSREARRAGLTVALSGVGGDELFAGYPSFRQVPQLKQIPGPYPGLKNLPGWQRFSESNDVQRKFMAYLTGDFPLEHPYFAVRGLRTRHQIDDLLNLQAAELLQAGSPALTDWHTMVTYAVRLAKRYDNVGEVSWLELSQYMRSTLLRDTDMMSMAHSLEVRVPYVDHSLVEHVLAVPGSKKLRRRERKPLLNDSVDGMLPAPITQIAKQTFTFPFQVWLKNSLAAPVGQKLSHNADILSPWLRPDRVANVWQSFLRGQTNWARPWSLYVLLEWVERYL